MTIKGVVKEMQAEVLSATESVFSQMSAIYQSAMSKALASVTASVSATLTATPGALPTINLDLETILAYLEALQSSLLKRPSYPTFSYTAPDLPALDTTPPDLSTVTIPVAPSLNLPTFDAVLEDEEMIMPSVEFDYAEMLYESGLHDALYNQLLDEISNGGYGINPDDESRLFERARERALQAMQEKIDGAVRLFSSGGFKTPTGAAAAAVQRAQSEADDKVAEINRDLAIQRGDMYLKGKELNQAGVLGLEKIDTDLHNARQDRALKAAAQRVTSVLEVAAFQKERLLLFMEKYKTLAAVYETQVKAESAKAEIYKVQVEAAEVEVKMNLALLEEFVARNKAIVDVFLAQVEEYKARIDGYSKYIGVLVEQYKADVGAFGAATDAYAKTFDMQAEIYKAQVDYTNSVFSNQVAFQRMKLDKAIASAQIDLEGAKTEVNAAAMVVSSALGAMNINASVSAAANATAGESYDETYYDPDGVHVQEHHNFTETGG